MTDVSQVETNVSFEPRTPPVNPSGGNGPDRATETSLGERDETAFSVDISSEALQLSANDDTAPQASSQNAEPQSAAGFDSTVETSATDGIDSSDGSVSDTNQVASLENEQAGNGSRGASEATRTLGQVVDTFA